MNNMQTNDWVTTENTTVSSKENGSNVEKDVITLHHMDKDFALKCMSVPTYSKEEYRLVTFIVLWARRNNIHYEFDDYGNLYLQKGELNEGEYFPCVTSHLDTVQDKQSPYIKAGVPLDLKIEQTKDGKHKVSVDTHSSISIGIGADDKSGVCICLSIFQHVEKLKACFFLEEEVGCIGSNHMDLDWFDNVGYVIGFDSPDLYRAAWSCSNVKLFSYDFYTKYMKEVCDKWGLTKGHFFSEPWTDVRTIRQNTDIICMNFGNGGYEAHRESEYCVLEDMDNACGMGIDLIKHIGNTAHRLKGGDSVWNHSLYKKDNNGIYHEVQKDDTSLLADLGDNTRNYGYAYHYTSQSTIKNDDIKFEKFNYIMARYDGYIQSIKQKLANNIGEIVKDDEVLKEKVMNAIDNAFKTDLTI